MKMYNVVTSTGGVGVIDRTVVSDMHEALFTLMASIETLAWVGGTEVVFSSMRCELDKSSFEMEVRYPDGTLFVTIHGTAVEVSDSDIEQPPSDEMPQQVVDQVSEMLARFMSSGDQ
jgi:hypothetical protein